MNSVKLFDKAMYNINASDYAKTAMQWAVGKGVITGNSETNTLTPHATSTRAEAASMLYKYCTKVQQCKKIFENIGRIRMKRKNLLITMFMFVFFAVVLLFNNNSYCNITGNED